MNPAPVVITVGPTEAQATRENTPYLPLTAEEIAAEVTAAYEAGASVASLHLRDAEGLPTADLEIGRRTIALIQEQSPILVQLSSGVSPTADLEDRLRLMDLKPRMATLSLCSMTFGQVEFRNPPDFVRRLAERMQELNIKPELEVYDTGHVDAALALAADGTPFRTFAVRHRHGCARRYGGHSREPALDRPPSTRRRRMASDRDRTSQLRFRCARNDSRRQRQDGPGGQLVPAQRRAVPRERAAGVEDGRHRCRAGPSAGNRRGDRGDAQARPGWSVRPDMDNLFPRAASAAHDVSSGSSRRVVASPTTGVGEDQNVYRP